MWIYFWSSSRQWYPSEQQGESRGHVITRRVCVAIALPAQEKPALGGTHRLNEASVHPSICAARSFREDEGGFLFNLFLLNLHPGLHLLTLNKCPLRY